MSTGTLSAVVLMVLALVGMGAWMLSLDHRQGDLEQTAGEGRQTGAPSRDTGDDLSRLRREVEQVKLVVDVHEGNLSEMESRQKKLDDSLGALGEQLAAIRSGAGSADAVSLPASEIGSLEKAIEAVLDDRREQERKSRTESMARRYGGYLLSDVDVTPDQREQVVQALLTFMDDREKLRNQYPDEGDRAARDAATANLEQARNEQLVRIVGAGGFAKMENRLNRFGRGRDSGRGRPRGGRGR